jgi:outer membrane protein TolC
MGMALACAVVLSGCANFSPDQGMGPVGSLASAELGKDVVKIRNEADAVHARQRVDALLSRTLSAEAAVQIALLNNRGLQAAFNELGVSEAQMVEATLPPSPTVSLSRAVVSGAVLEIERQVLQNILGLLTLPRRREIAETRFRQAQLAAMEAVLRLAGETRRTYVRATAAGQAVIFLKQAQLSAESLSDLATKLGETGAMNKLNQAREHAFYADVTQQLALARVRHRTERERLARLMGLWGADSKFRLPDELMRLPRRPRSLGDVERQAVASRVDLQMARLELELMAKSYGLTRATRFVNVLELRGLSKTEWTRITETDYELVGGNLVKTQTPVTEKDRWRGVELEFQIPIYDFGEARTRGAREAYFRAVNLLADKAVNVRGEAREAYQIYRGAYDIAKLYQDRILPLRKTISDEMLLRYNGMLSDLFELLQDQRARISTNVAAIEARRDFLLAGVDLDTALLGGGGMNGMSGGAAMRTAAAADAGGGH